MMGVQQDTLISLKEYRDIVLLYLAYMGLQEESSFYVFIPVLYILGHETMKDGLHGRKSNNHLIIWNYVGFQSKAST